MIGTSVMKELVTFPYQFYVTMERPKTPFCKNPHHIKASQPNEQTMRNSCKMVQI